MFSMKDSLFNRGANARGAPKSDDHFCWIYENELNGRERANGNVFVWLRTMKISEMICMVEKNL